MSDYIVFPFCRWLSVNFEIEAWRWLPKLSGAFSEAAQARFHGNPLVSNALYLTGAILSISGFIESEPFEHLAGLRLLSAADYKVSREMVEHLVEVLRAEASGAPEEASKDAVNYLGALSSSLGNENSL